MGASGGDDRNPSRMQAPEEFDEAEPDLEALIDQARRLDSDQLRTLLRLIRQALAEQDAAP